MRLVDGELPDYLPVVLEFAATADPDDGLALLREHRAGLELLALRLDDAESAVRGTPSTAVCAMLPAAAPGDVAAATGWRSRARRWNRSG